MFPRLVLNFCAQAIPPLWRVASMILEDVYNSLKEKGYNPISQMAGYLLSGDPTYITSHNNARSNIRRLERDELVEELLSSYVKHRNL